jgi:glycolate oxidase
MGGIVIGTSRMRRILEINVEDRYAIVEPGVINVDLSAAAAPYSLCFVPDPSSQTVSTLGGNVAENAGGPHCLAYGMTSNHVLGMEVVLADGEVVRMGGVAPHGPGYDVRGVMIGSEGTLGIVTKITVRLLPRPTDARTMLAIFDALEDAGRAVSTIIARGMVPAALEIMDALTMQAVEASVHAGYPPDAVAGLLLEVDGYADGLDALTADIEAICRECGSREIRMARSGDERAALWKGRKSAFGAMGRIAPSYYVQDGVVPRSRLPEVLHFALEVSKKYNLKIANVLHAGDGNLHPLVTFDPRQPGVIAVVRAASSELLRKCVELGGTITGEHGVGLEKQDFMTWLFNDGDLAQMRRLKAVFDPRGSMNPGKIFPGERHLAQTYNEVGVKHE